MVIGPHLLIIIYTVYSSFIIVFSKMKISVAKETDAHSNRRSVDNGLSTLTRHDLSTASIDLADKWRDVDFEVPCQQTSASVIVSPPPHPLPQGRGGIRTGESVTTAQTSMPAAFLPQAPTEQALLKRQSIFLMINALILCWEAFFLYYSLHAVTALTAWAQWSPLFILPILHQETEILTTAFRRTPLDNHLLRYESYLPSLPLIRRISLFHSTFFSECLHVCYLSFYCLIYGVPLYFYALHDDSAYYESLFAILLLLFSCYITHGLIPVCGPRQIVKKINDVRSKGYFFQLTHRILEKGSTYATAFPSGHAGTAGIILLMTWHLQTPLFYALLPIALGLILSTIYGRFHYVIDTIVGLLYALFVFGITLLFYP